MRKLIYSFLTIIIGTLSLVMFSINTVEAATPEYEFYFTEYVTGSESMDDRATLENYYNSSMQAVRLKLNARSLTGSNLHLATIQVDLSGTGPFNDILNVQSASTTIDDGWGGVTTVKHWDVTFNAHLISLSYESTSSTNSGMNQTVTPAGTELATVFLGYDITNTDTAFSYTMTYSINSASYWSDSSGSMANYIISDDKLQFNSFNVGNVGAAPNADLDTISIKGASNTVYYNGSLGESPSINTVEITYQDAQNPLTITPVLVNQTATYSLSGATIPYSNGDVITLTVSDGEGASLVTKTYGITLNVPTPKTANSLSNLTVNSGDITPAFDPNTTEYTLNLDYAESTATINAYV
ncbi:MAG: hypothetical protein PHF05_06290, partial [Candidatus Izemoplasmatales bacterium]|nr:hypothetical protein [Candidatus Izemoplasmatales bacterium]